MRKLMWFAIGFAAACAVAAYLLLPAWLLIGATVTFGAAAMLFFFKPKVCRILAVVFLGCAIGFSWFWGYYKIVLQDAAALDGQKFQTEMTVSDYSKQTDYGCVVEGTVRFENKTYKVYTYLNLSQQLVPGDRISGDFTLRYIAYGSNERTDSHACEGIYLKASVSNLTVTHGKEKDGGNLPAQLRWKILQLLDEVFPEDTASFARALLLGDTSRMSYEMRSAFSVTGISHVVAVSGLHIGMLYALLGFLLRYRRGLLALIGIPVLILFAAVAGFTPSVVRACIMQSLIIISTLVVEEYDSPTALGLSVLVLLASNPLTITSVGFQLSVACLVGILAFSQKIYHYLTGRQWIASSKGNGLRARIVRGVLISISISISVWVVTIPLCAAYFGMISVVSVVTNLLLVWMITYIFCGIMMACIFGAVWLPLGAALGWLISWPIRLLQWAVTAISKVPFAAVYTASGYIVLWLIGCYVLIGLFVLMKFAKPRLLLICICAALVISVCAACVEERRGTMGITVLDVGQGQCVILKNEDRYYMVDCGGSSSTRAADTAIAYLHSRGIFCLDGVILTHYDSDHAEGVEKLLTRIPVTRMYLPDVDPESPIRRKLEQEYARTVCMVDGICRIADTDITMICGDEDKLDNESGICILFQPENYDILITGDRSRSGERILMEQYSLPKLELLIAGHHGSAGSTSMELLKQTMPETVVISVGENNSFGHPAQELLQRLELFGCRVLRTDQDGTIEIKG